MVAQTEPTEMTQPHRVDRIQGLDSFENQPTIVQISDIHGYIESARSALLAVGEVEQFDPIVEQDADGKLHWVGDREHVLVFNGDMIDRGPASDECLELVWRLQREAPPGHVRYHLGNHEMALLFPDVLRWSHWYAGKQPPATRRDFYDKISDGQVTVAFEGYEYTYSHAGSGTPIHVPELNESLRTAARELRGAIGDRDWADVQRSIVSRFPAVFGLSEPGGRGPDAGVLWLDYRYMPEDAPKQVVGHTRQRTPTREGTVICGNVIRNNQGSIGGEGVIVETPDRIGAITRKEDRSVSCTYFDN